MNDFCQWFQRKIFKNLKKCTKLPIIPLKIGVHQRNIHTKFATNPCISLRDGQKWGKQRLLIKQDIKLGSCIFQCEVPHQLIAQ